MKDSLMIPVLNDDWVITGTKEIPRLFNKISNKIIKLDNEVLNYILDCDGTHTYKEIGEKYGMVKYI